MAKRTTVNLSQWRRKKDGMVCGIPLGILLPQDWVSPVVDEMLNPAASEWEGIGNIEQGTRLERAERPPCMAADNNGNVVECELAGITFFTIREAVEDFELANS